MPKPSLTLYALSVCTAVAILMGCSGGAASQLAPSAPAGRAQPHREPIWWTFYYTPSGYQLLRTQADYASGTASFTFVAGVFTALLTTKDESLTGDLTGKQLSDNVAVSGATSAFVTQNGGSCGNSPTVRFFFRRSGFDNTHFWWANPQSYTLANGGATLTASLADPSQWSDWNGKFGTSHPRDFYAAVAHVSQIGLSYGGGCFFENGATVSSGSALFTSQFSEM
jgi:hypothetical protein